jgi:hypothetical protein
MNPFEDSDFLKDIKRCYIIREMIKNKNNKKYDIIDANFKLNNNVITISIKQKNIAGVYKYQYILKQKQILDIKHKNNSKNINNICEKIERMVIDDE